jgi:hypothetical protein
MRTHTYIYIERAGGDLYIIIYAAGWYRMARMAAVKNWGNSSADTRAHCIETAHRVRFPYHTARRHDK